MSTRSGLRPRKSAVGLTEASPAVHYTPAARKVRKPAKVSPGDIISCVNQFRISSETLSSPVLTPMQGIRAAVADASSNRFDSIIDRDDTPDHSSTIDALMETPAPATAQPLYPNLDALTANADLYPTLKMGSKTPARRRLYAPLTTARKAGRKSLATQTVLPVTPTKPIDNSTVPKTTTFEFKFSAGLEEAGKKVLEELKISSAALQAHMKDEAAKRAAGLESEESSEANKTPATTRNRRFSAEHRKQFSKMPSIADHYSAKRAKAAAAQAKPITPTNKTADAGTPKTPHPPKTLKRKNAAEESKPTTPFKPPQTLVTSDTEMADDSPISRKRAKFDSTPMTQPRAKMAKFATPGPLTATPISKPLQYAGHQHGLTRTTAVKQSAMKQSSLPRVIRKEAAPSTPSKPLAVATPLKKETLLASPSKARPPGTIAKPAASITQPGTPSPVKISVPLTSSVETFNFLSEMKAPVFDKEKLHKAAAAKPSVRFADKEDEETEEEVEEEEGSLMPASTLPAARSLFDSGVILKPTLLAEKRKAVSQDEHGNSAEEDEEPRLLVPTRNKRVRMDIPEINFTPMKGASSPMKSSLLASVARKVTQPVRNPRIHQLATPKKRTVLSPKTDGKKIQKPRWK